MNLDLVQQELDGLAKKPTQKREKVDFSKILWKPTEGKHQVRFLPSKVDPDMPFLGVLIHYGLAKYPIYSLMNWGEDDPIVEFSEKLKSTGDKEDYQLGYKLAPKKRYFAPVLVRGEEDKAVRLWEFGPNIYKQLLALASDEEVGDFTDPIDGRDFTVVGEKGQVGNRDVILPRITPKMKSSPVTEDSDLLSDYLENQPDILESQIKFSFEKMKEFLSNFLDTGESSDEKSPDEDDDLPWEKEEKVPTPSKGAISGKFNKYFDEG
jgi:hypothetical protein